MPVNESSKVHESSPFHWLLKPTPLKIETRPHVKRAGSAYSKFNGLRMRIYGLVDRSSSARTRCNCNTGMRDRSIPGIYSCFLARDAGFAVMS